MNFNFLTTSDPEWMAWLVAGPVLRLILDCIVHIGFALAVASHAKRRNTALVPSWLWILATLMAGPLVGVGYWFLHGSPAGSLRGASSQAPSSQGSPGFPPSSPRR